MDGERSVCLEVGILVIGEDIAWEEKGIPVEDCGLIGACMVSHGTCGRCGVGGSGTCFAKGNWVWSNLALRTVYNLSLLISRHSKLA